MKRIKNEIRRILAWILAWLFCVSAGMPPAMAYSNEDGPYFDTLLEARNYLQQCIGEIQEEISFRLPDDLLNEMGESELKRELLLMTGEARCHTHILDDETDYICVYMVPTYYPGTRIVKAWRSGRLDSLSDEEIQVLELALQIVREEKKESETMLVLERRLHDRICQMVTYEKRDPDYEGETIQRVCSAIGALLDGRANCQGYTDAFYLLGTLAGLTVGRQNGKDASGGNHMWNTIQWTSGWYAVDVTADDTDLEGDVGSNYTHFNIGRDMCTGILEWPEHYETADIIERTDTTYFYFTQQEEKNGQFGEAFNSMDELSDYVYSKRLNQSQSVVWVMLYNQTTTADDLHEALKNTAIKNGHRNTAKWTAWSWNVGKHTYYMVRWNTF